jgi:glycosyltransferase involved in cell wall biosynthesis
MECRGNDKNSLSRDSKLEGGKRSRHPIARGKSSHPSISIVTAVYNGVGSIEETIRSVIGQTYDNFEYIIVDGGSTDGTIGKLMRYDDQIDYWISEPDNGVYDAMNKGIELAQGDWIYFLGADDVLLDEDVLKRVFAIRPKGKLIYGNVLWGDSGRVYDGVFSKGKLIWHNICQQSIFYHKTLFRTLGTFDVQYPLLADWVFNMRAFAGHRVNPCHVDTIVARYSLSGLSSRKSDDVFLANRELLIYRIFGFRYHQRLIHHDAAYRSMVADEFTMGLLSFWRDIIHHLAYLNHLEKTRDDRLSLFYSPRGWRSLSRSYKFLAVTLPQGIYNCMNFLFPHRSMRRRCINKMYYFICALGNKPAK